MKSSGLLWKFDYKLANIMFWKVLALESFKIINNGLSILNLYEEFIATWINLTCKYLWYFLCSFTKFFERRGTQSWVLWILKFCSQVLITKSWRKSKLFDL